MNCAIFDLGCHIHQVIDPIWFWIFWGFWAVVALGVLWALSQVKNIAGWPGVAAVAAVLIYFAGVFRVGLPQKVKEDDLVHVDSAGNKLPRVRPKPGKGSRVYNPDTGEWELR